MIGVESFVPVYPAAKSGSGSHSHSMVMRLEHVTFMSRRVKEGMSTHPAIASFSCNTWKSQKSCDFSSPCSSETASDYDCLSLLLLAVYLKLPWCACLCVCARA